MISVIFFVLLQPKNKPSKLTSPKSLLMKKLFFLIAFLVFSISSFATLPEDGTLCVYLKSGKVEIVPGKLIKQHSSDTHFLNITLQNDSVLTYKMSEVDSLGNVPTNHPNFTMFKFNNKYNHNVYVDVFAEIGENEITATIPSIGKSLTPSYQLDQMDGVVTVDGVPQTSKVSRHRFDKPVVYTLVCPNSQELYYTKIQDEVWSDPIPGKPTTQKIPLNASMLSTNAPSNYGEDLHNLVDNDVYTFFHSTWGGGSYTPLPLTESPYIEVSLQEDLDKFVFEYTTSNSHNNRFPYEFIIQASKDKRSWVNQDTINEKDGIPQTGYGQFYKSPTIHLKDSYRYLRFKLTKASHKNYLVLAELALYKVIAETPDTPSQLISPAKYEYRWQAYGKKMPVKINWLTDQATNVPRVDIDVQNGQMIEDKTTYLSALLTIDGAGVFPNMTESILIRGRGNISWVGTGKSPYRIKFPQSAKPFGLTKGRNWVLLANRQGGSMMTNAVGMKIANMVKTSGANEMIPVELYINGEYRGSYNFTQHVGLHNNSVDIIEDNAVLLELDSYYDEDYRFRSDYYNLPTNVKDPDYSEPSPTPRYVTFEMIKEDFNHFCQKIYEGTNDYTDLMNVPMFARFLLVNDLIQNYELNHPKSCFLYKEDMLAMHSQYIFGPVWDFDWGFGYRSGSGYCLKDPETDLLNSMNGIGGQFFRDVFTNDIIQRAYYKEWKKFMESGLQEVMEYIDDYYQYAQQSFRNNASRWGDGNNYDREAEKMKKWLTTRAEYIYSHLKTFDLNEKLPIEVGDVNEDGAITIADAICVQNHILNLPVETFNAQQADANKNGKINITDAVWIVALAMKTEANQEQLMQLPAANGALLANKFMATMGTESIMPLTLQIKDEGYQATQFDLTLPEGLTFTEITLPEEWHSQTVEFAELGNQKYRVAIYSSNGMHLPKGNATLQLHVTPNEMIAHEARIVSLDAASLVTNEGEDNRMSCLSTTFDIEDTTGIANNAAKEIVNGGKMLTVESLNDGDIKIYTMDGRLVKRCQVKAGMNTIALPSGIYIVNQQKVVINN